MNKQSTCSCSDTSD